MSVIGQVAQVASYITTIAAAVVLLVRPLRERVVGMKKAQEEQRLLLEKAQKEQRELLNKTQDGQRCLLRSDMLRIYYRHKDERKIRQYEYENFLMEYEAYKALNGNSFVEYIYNEMREWEVGT